MATVEKSIEVDVPVTTAYNQWTQFESFPSFMDGVEEVRQVDDRRLHWKARVGGREQEWDAEITEQVPDKRIAWRSIGGSGNAGVVTFHRLSDTSTRVMLQMETEPAGVVEKAGEMAGATARRVEKDLAGFKGFIEQRGTETGAWRGSVEQPGS